MVLLTKIPRNARIPVLQYHDHWVCVDKPPGLTVHRSEKTPKHERVLTGMVRRQLGRKVFPVHRLDHRTSGAILLAFDAPTAGQLHGAALRRGHKQYLALVRGNWTEQNHTVTVDRPLLDKSTNVTQEATTRFTLLGNCGSSSSFDDASNYNGQCSLLLCEPLTGRTHQIRRHAFGLGHPILGDTQHGDSKINRWWRQNRGLDRLALHSWTLRFTLDEQDHFCVSPLPLPFRSVLEKLDDNLWQTALQQEPLLRMEPYDEKGDTPKRYNKE